MEANVKMSIKNIKYTIHLNKIITKGKRSYLCDKTSCYKRLSLFDPLCKQFCCTLPYQRTDRRQFLLFLFYQKRDKKTCTCLIVKGSTLSWWRVEDGSSLTVCWLPALSLSRLVNGLGRRSSFSLAAANGEIGAAGDGCFRFNAAASPLDRYDFLNLAKVSLKLDLYSGLDWSASLLLHPSSKVDGGSAVSVSRRLSSLLANAAAGSSSVLLR